MDSDNREAQMQDMKGLREELDRRGIHVELVADEWCNTLEDVIYFCDNKAGHMIQVKTPDLGSIHNTVEALLYCEKTGLGAYMGGTCNETDRSAQVCIHCAMATNADQILAKPGMGVDEDDDLLQRNAAHPGPKGCGHRGVSSHCQINKPSGDAYAPH